jgi:hypothetical protein
MRAVLVFLIGIAFGYVMAQRPAQPDPAPVPARFTYTPTWTMSRGGTWSRPN